MSTETTGPREYLAQQREQAEQRRREQAQQVEQARLSLLSSLADGDQPSDLEGELQVAQWTFTELGEQLEIYLQRRQALQARERGVTLEREIAKAQAKHQAALAKRDEVLRELDAEVSSAYAAVQGLESERVQVAAAERTLRESAPQWITDQLSELHKQGRAIQAELDALSPHVGQQPEVEAATLRSAEIRLYEAQQKGQGIEDAESHLDAVQRDLEQRQAKRQALTAQADEIRQQVDRLNELIVTDAWPTH